MHNSRSLPPGALIIDQMIENHLNEFDSTPRCVRDASAIVGRITMQLSEERALVLLTLAHKLLEDQRSETGNSDESSNSTER